MPATVGTVLAAGGRVTIMSQTLSKHVLNSLAVGFLTAGIVRAEQVVFSEIMYHPPAGLPEYLEVENLTSTVFDIANWRLAGGADHRFPDFSAGNPDRTFLQPFERIVLSSTDEATTRTAYGIPAGVRIFGPWEGSLSNGGERVTLKDEVGITLCSVEYGDRGHWSPAADGAGHSLVLVNPNDRIDDWRNWRASSQRLGTPGTAPIIATAEPVPNPELREEEGLTLIEYGATWRYDDTATDLGTVWRESDYNDIGWDAGPALLGVENSALPAPGLQTDINKGSQLTYYFRHSFPYNGTLDGVTLEIDQIIDDGVIYWLNGQELGRVRVAPGNVDFNTQSNGTVGNAAEELAVIQIPATALRQGVNVLAAEVHQTNPGSSDIVFGMRLRALVPLTTAEGLVINEVAPGAAGTGFIEVLNPTAAPIDLKDHYLSDNSANLRKLRIATSLAVSPGGLATVGFTESGFTVANPVTVYLTAPDGVSVLNALRADIPLDGRSLGRMPDGSGSWFIFADPSRKAANGGSNQARDALAINEVRFSDTNTVDRIEIHNRSGSAVLLDGLQLASQREFLDAVPLAGSLPPGGQRVLETAFAVAGGEVTLHLADANRNILDAHLFTRPTGRDSLQAFPDGTAEWYSTDTDTPGSPNAPARQTGIVINEIMCDPPSNLVDGEFIELHNRAAVPIDVSGWRLDEAVRFRIPDGTFIPAGGHLAIAANLDRMRSAHGAIPAVGNYSGRLGNEGDLIRLLDPWGNLADEVDYRIRGDWPELLGGMGSSLELVHPDMDNGVASAWTSSREGQKGPWRDYAYRDTYRQLTTLGGVSDYREIYLHLVGDGHVILDNIQLIRVSTGQNVLVNADRLSPNNRSADGWLAQGTHWQSYLDGSQLHLISTGRGDNRANRIEIDVPDLTSGQQYEIRFRGRWVEGNPRVVFSTWDHSVATSFLLEVPARLGTPGSANSARRSSPPPTISHLLHSPAVPTSNDPVLVTARVSSALPLTSVELKHRPDNINANAAWQTMAMTDDGSNGDDMAGDGLFSATLTQYQGNGQIVQFYVEASTASGGSSVLPQRGSERPAMFVVDNRAVTLDLRVNRFVVSAYDVNAIQNGETAKYEYKFPRLSNHYKNATFISNERDVYYNAEIRNSGSPWTRGTDLARGKFKVPEDRRFRGQIKFFFDNDPDAGRLFNNRMTRYLLYRVGHPASQNEFIWHIVNSDAPRLREDTEPTGNDMLDRLFTDGSRGSLYRIDDEWWFQDDWNRRNRDADWNYKGTDNAGRYRTEWMKRTNEDEDDFTDLITFFKTVSGSYTEADAARLIDVDETMKMFVVRGYIDDWDSISRNRGKNGYMYRRPGDGLLQFLHWDSDLTFGDSNAPFIGNLPRVGTWIQKPLNLRVFHYYLAELIEQHTRNSARTLAWLDAEESSSPRYTVSKTQFVGWFNNRETPARNVMGAHYNRPFGIAGSSVESDGSVTVTGTAPTGVFEISVAGHPETETVWTSIANWEIRGLRLAQGEHELALQPVDRFGQPVLHLGTPMTPSSLAIAVPGNPPPVATLAVSPASWHVAAGERIELDARDSYDPDGTPVTFVWQVQPDAKLWQATSPGRVEAMFQRPGLYAIDLSVEDQEGQKTEMPREAAVYGPQGFSGFNGRLLDDFWRLDGVSPRGNYTGGDWVTLDLIAGHLVLQTLEDASRPLASAPRVWRPLPATTDWAFETKAGLISRRFGSFLTGIAVDLEEAGGTSRVCFGLDGGNRLTVRRLTPAGAEQSLHTSLYGANEAVLRIRRDAQGLRFDRKEGEVWTSLHTLPLAPAVDATAVGLLASTSAPEAVQVAFDYALLVDPSDTSSLRENLIVSELMYNPPGGDDYEFLELANIGAGPLDLTGARFDEGITYTFGETLLQPGELIVITRNPAVFSSHYGTEGIRLAPGGYSGKLDNGGEQLTLVDASNVPILSLRYDDAGAWPGRPDGLGSSLEVALPGADPNDASTWSASKRVGGSPGLLQSPAPPPVVINEIMAHSDPPFEDAIELHNTGNAAVDLSGWYLTDSADDLTRFRIPDGTVIGARGYVVFYEQQFNLNNVRVPFAFSSAQGDEALLISANAGGSPLEFVDTVSFGPSLNSVPFGRWPNGSGNLTPLSRQTLGTDMNPWDPAGAISFFRLGQGAHNAPPRVGPVVITEIMYHPPDGQDEYLELANIASEPTPLFDPLHPENLWQLVNGVQFAFPPDTTLQPEERVLLTEIDPALFRARHGIPAATRIFGPWTGSLDNAGEAVEIAQPDAPQTVPPIGLVPYVVVERVRYDNHWPWPSEPDGHGASLVRISPTQYGDDSANWTASGVSPNQDTDGDGMPDVWEKAHSLNPNFAGDANLDADNDGVSNLDEFRAGTDPRDPGSRLMIHGLEVVGSETRLTLRFTAAAGRAYRVEYCGNLADTGWQTLQEVLKGDAREVVVTDPDLDGGARFYRLVLTDAP